MPEQIYSVAELAQRLMDTSREYLHHFDPGAPLDVSTIRLELAGPSVSLIFAQTGSNPPTLQVFLNAIESAVTLAPHEATLEAQREREAARGEHGRFFGR